MLPLVELFPAFVEPSSAPCRASDGYELSSMAASTRPGYEGTESNEEDATVSGSENPHSVMLDRLLGS